MNRPVKNKIAKPGKSTVKLYFNSMNEIMNEGNKYNFQLNNSLKSHHLVLLINWALLSQQYCCPTLKESSENKLTVQEIRH